MASQTQTLTSAYWMRKPEAVGAPRKDYVLPMEAVLDEFVARVRDNPKVWAVYAKQECSVVEVWTYVDSADRRDRKPVHDVEWEILQRFPEAMFDFNVLLRPSGSEQFERDGADYLYTR